MLLSFVIFKCLRCDRSIVVAVAQEENAMGRFLKTHSSHDKTRAGKMMVAVGKSQSFSAQQRSADLLIANIEVFFNL